MQSALRRLLSLSICLFPSAAFAQSITTTPATAVPVGSPWLLFAFGLMLLGGIYWMLRHTSRGRFQSGIAALAFAAAVGVAFVLHAQATLMFTDASGETLSIPITTETSGENVEGWEPADFTNNSGVTLLIEAIDTPTLSECFPGGLVGEVIHGSPDDSPHPLCEVGDALDDGATCRVDVETICRAAAAGNLATLADISPAMGTEEGGTVVTLTGTNLSGVTAVTFDGVPATDVSAINTTTVVATTPAHAPGVVDVRIFTPVGGPAQADVFTFFTPLTLTSVTADSGAASGGVGITLTGTALAGTTGVTFGGVAATFVNVVDSTTVTAVTPAHAAGVVDIEVTTPDGSVTLSDGFTYVSTAVGQPAFGGIIAALNGGLNNLIAAVADHATQDEWGPNGVTVGAGGQSTTDGAANTTAIVAALGNNGNVAYAAGICNAYEVDSQGNTPCQAGNACYNDWFLPAGNNVTATGQLNALYTNRAAIGGFSNAYWSSTEFNSNDAWVQLFLTGAEATAFKPNGARIRCVRAFTP